jgi:hypothetical protein
MIVEQIVQIRRLNLDDAGSNQQQELLAVLAQIEKKWSHLHASIKDYRDALAKENAFHKLYEEIELWTTQKRQVIQRLVISKGECQEIREVEHVLTQIETNMQEVRKFADTKVKYLTQLAVQIYGENHQQPKVKHVATKNFELLNNLIEIKAETETLKTTIAEKLNKNATKMSQMYHELPLEEPETPPDFKKRLESAIVFTGSKHTFECVADGTRPFTITWLKDGQVVNSDSSNMSICIDEKTGSTSLTLTKASQSDNSLFSCRILNELGTAETSAYLKVKDYFKPKGSAPLIVTPLESIQLNPESNYTLECIISGEPEPCLTWFKDNVEITEASEHFKIGRFMNVRQLTVLNANPEIHSGTYTCRAKNEYGEANCSCGILIRSIIKCFEVKSELENSIISIVFKTQSQEPFQLRI